MTIWRRWISGGASAPARVLAGRFVSGGASDPPPSSVRAAILAGSCDDIVGGDDASEPFRAEFLISARIATFRCTLSKTLRGKRPGAKDLAQRNLAPRMPAKGACLLASTLPPLSEGRLFRRISPHLAGVSLYVAPLPTWRGFFFRHTSPHLAGHLFMAHISSCCISPQIRE